MLRLTGLNHDLNGLLKDIVGFWSRLLFVPEEMDTKDSNFFTAW